MLALGRYIEELFYDYECVIVPNFGAFNTKYRESTYHASTNVMYPPRKELTFNSFLKTDDGLLVNYICLKTGKSIDEIEGKVHETVHEWKKNLDIKKEIYLKNIGKIWVSRANDLLFEASHIVNYLSSSYGLVKIESVVEKEEPEKIKKHLFKDKYDSASFVVDNKREQNILEQEFVVRKNSGLGSFLTVLIFMTLGTIVYQLYNFGYLDDFIKDVVEVVEGTTANSNTQKQKSIENNTNSLGVKSMRKAYVTNKKYHVMAGVYRSKKDALQKVKYLIKKRFTEAEYIGINNQGLHEVTYGSFNDLEKAKELLKKVKTSIDKSIKIKVIN